jgi:hypothetical protein
MEWRRLGTVWTGFALALGLCGSAAGADASPAAAAARDLTATIDDLIAARWQATGTRPAAPAGDAEFLRRVSLDLTGRIPAASEVRDFLDDRAPDKRVRLVERLLQSPGYSAHMAALWKELLVPEAASSTLLQYLVTDFDPWLRRMFAENVGYDVMVRRIVTAEVKATPNPRGIPIGQGPPTPLAFYAAKEGKPENLAAATARVFLGVRLECAQCHDHPFARWKRDEFWSYAAFFAGIERAGGANANGFFQGREVPDRREIAVPGTDRVAQASFLDHTEPVWVPRVGPRVVLADWMTRPDNPYFARAAVNRIWAHLLGTGLVDPVDDLGAENPPSHPELLDALARAFAAHQFDLHYMIRAIVASRAYGLSSAGDSATGDDPRLFARMPVRGMTPLQLYESLMQASGLPREPEQPPYLRGDASFRREFLEKFASPDEKATEPQTSILQVLTLMNGRLMTAAVSLEAGGTLPAIAAADFLDTPARLEALYLAALGRRPRPDELARLTAYVERSGKPALALADIFWALLNSAEFRLIH